VNRLAGIPLVLFLGCGLAAPREGRLVSEGVGRAVFETRNAGTDLIAVTVLYPATEAGGLRGRALPAVVFVQGGFVATSRYEWQAVELARAGYVVALAENALQLAFFSVDSGEAARRLLATPPPGSLLEGAVDPERIAVAGHSLGSVVALKLALNGKFKAVALQAGFPDPADDAKLPTFDKPSLSLAGELDCSAKLDGVRSGWEELPSPSALVVLSGVTHFQFTVTQDDDEQRGCPPSTSLDDAHARIVAVLRAFLDAALTDGSVGEASLRQVPGATVEVR
jgi:dienelactone hydrolase